MAQHHPQRSQQNQIQTREPPAAKLSRINPYDIVAKCRKINMLLFCLKTYSNKHIFEGFILHLETKHD